MAVDQVTRMWSKRRAAITTQTFKKRTLRQFDTYQVTVDDPETTIDDIVTDSNVPKVGDTIAGLPALRVRAVEPFQVSPLLWHVPVTWEGEIGPDGPTDDPLNAPPEIDWGDVESDEPIDEDVNGNPIVTANFEPINGVTMKLPDAVLNVKRNFADINLYLIGQYRRSVNSDVFMTWPAGTAKLIKYTAKKKNATDDQDNTQGYWEVAASIQFRYPYRTTAYRAWWARVLHQGLYVRTTPNGRIVRATDDEGNPSTKPVLLDNDGLQTTTARWREYQRYQYLPYNSLGLLD